MGKHIDQATKEQALLEIKNGVKVSEVSVKYNIGNKTLYAWLGTKSDNTGTSLMEVAKLRRENQELKELVGFFALQEKRGKKNKHGA
jgi:transposase-like protein